MADTNTMRVVTLRERRIDGSTIAVYAASPDSTFQVQHTLSHGEQVYEFVTFKMPSATRPGLHVKYGCDIYYVR